MSFGGYEVCPQRYRHILVQPEVFEIPKTRMI